MRTTLLTLICLASLASSAAATTHTFSGTCQSSGTSVTERPSGVTPTFGPVTFRGSGACTGSIDGSPVASHPIEIAAAGEGDLGCATVTATGRGALRFTRGTATTADDAVLRWRFAIPLHPASIQIYGREGGLAHGSLAFTGADKPPTACLDGSWRRFDYQVVFSTLSTLRG